MIRQTPARHQNYLVNEQRQVNHHAVCSALHFEVSEKDVRPEKFNRLVDDILSSLTAAMGGECKLSYNGGCTSKPGSAWLAGPLTLVLTGKMPHVQMVSTSVSLRLEW
jgi:hypothetical protein